jgi:adenylyltransferase/sulfurtransferase
MGLSNQQIERYARQIIVPGFGGIGQERLLAARLILAGRPADIASVLAYLAGAGVGEIRLRLPPNGAAAHDSLRMYAAQLNPDVVVKPDDGAANVNLVLAIGGDSEISELIAGLVGSEVSLIFARLDEPASIAIIPSVPPCLACADANLLAPFRRHSTNAGFVTMIAASEALKSLTATATTSGPALLLFNGFACSRRELRQDPLRAKCSCS